MCNSVTAMDRFCCLKQTIDFDANRALHYTSEVRFSKLMTDHVIRNAP